MAVWGGGGGGGLQLATPARLTVTGKILSNGGHAGAAYANGLGQQAGPGGGGAGGNIELYAGNLVVGSTAVLQARGGAGGGLGTEPVPFNPFYYSCEANGGRGFIFISAGEATIDAAAFLDARVELRPALGIQRDGAALIVSWPAPSTGYVLQETASLAQPAWSDVTVPSTVVDGENRVDVSPPLTARFYRLMRP